MGTLVKRTLNDVLAVIKVIFGGTKRNILRSKKEFIDEQHYGTSHLMLLMSTCVVTLGHSLMSSWHTDHHALGHSLIFACYKIGLFIYCLLQGSKRPDT